MGQVSIVALPPDRFGRDRHPLRHISVPGPFWEKLASISLPADDLCHHENPIERRPGLPCAAKGSGFGPP